MRRFAEAHHHPPSFCLHSLSSAEPAALRRTCGAVGRRSGVCGRVVRPADSPRGVGGGSASASVGSGVGGSVGPRQATPALARGFRNASDLLETSTDGTMSSSRPADGSRGDQRRRQDRHTASDVSCGDDRAGGGWLGTDARDRGLGSRVKRRGVGGARGGGGVENSWGAEKGRGEGERGGGGARASGPLRLVMALPRAFPPAPKRLKRHRQGQGAKEARGWGG